MNNVTELRNEIDQQIRMLYRQRMELDQQMGAAEVKSDLRELLEDAVEHTEAQFPEYATVAVQGVEGSYAETAARKLFPGSCNFSLNLRSLSLSKFVNIATAITLSAVVSIKLNHRIIYRECPSCASFRNG